MKARYIILALWACLSGPALLTAQTTYEQMLRDAAREKAEGRYLDAILKYNAAKRRDPAKAAEVDQLILKVFEETNQLKEEAEADKKKAEAAEKEARRQADLALREKARTARLLKEVEKEKTRSDSLLEVATALQEKNQRIIDAMYFYDGKYALAVKNKYGFIDKEGNVRIAYKYDDANPFDRYTGFARVKKKKIDKEELYLIDTTGREYRLAESIGQLAPEIEALDLREKELAAFPDTILAFSQLKVLLLSGNQLAELPGKISQLKDLRYLDLSRNQLNSLPSEIGQLSGLQSLNLAGNQLSSIPSEIGWLTALQSLDLSENRLGFLPSEIGQLTNIQSLDLSRNQLSALPPDIGRLSGLEFLNLGGNQLSELPLEIGQLSGIQTLNLYNNQLSALPPEIGNLSGLELLNLGGNQLSELPSEIGQLANIQSLDLSRNPLRALPAGIGNLSGLELLNLSDNQLSTLPSEIWQLGRLQNLYLFGNQLNVLPSEIGQLSGLQSLDLSGNQLNVLPPDIGRLFGLGFLNLGDNQLSALPSEIGHLSGLQSLDLFGNQLSALPPDIGRLSGLEFLNLGGNQLSALPSEIWQLPGLQSLDLSGNQLSVLPPDIGKLSGLEFLDLGSNQLNTLPSDIGKLSGLEFLNLGGNQLSALPLTIIQLNLENLDLSHNKLNRFPSELCHFNNLQDLDLSGNPLNKLSSDLDSCKNPAILIALVRGLEYEIACSTGSDSLRLLYQELERLSKLLAELREEQEIISAPAKGGVSGGKGQYILIGQGEEYIGKILNYATRLPIPGVAVAATNQSTNSVIQASTDVNGDYALTLNSNSTYVFRYSLPGYRDISRMVETGEGNNHDILGVISMLPINGTEAPGSGSQAGVGGDRGVISITGKSLVLGSGYAVQIAALKNPGLESYSSLSNIGQVYSKYEGGFYKVRIGVFTSRNEASSALNALKARGYKDTFIVTEEGSANGQAKGAHIEATEWPSEGGRYMVQLGVFRNPLNFNAAGLDQYGNIEERVRGGLTVKLLGSFGDIDEAKQAWSHAKAVGFSNAFIVLDTGTEMRKIYP